MLNILKASYAGLTVSERRVAEVCLENPVKFATMPVSEIGQLAHVSKPTVVRFCRKVGYQGLVDFKRKLLTNCGEGTPFIHPKVAARDSASVVGLKLIDSAIGSIMHLRGRVGGAEIEAAVAALSRVHQNAGRILIFGVGYSGLVAQDCCWRFSSIGMLAVHFSDCHMQMAAASSLDTNDCAIVFSASGRTRDMLEIANLVQRQQVTLLAITPSHSPLARLSDIHLAADHEESLQEFNPMSSRLVQLIASDILVTTAALSIDCKKAQARLESIQTHLTSRRV